MRSRRIDVKPRSELEDTLGYKFKKPELLRQALPHASAISEKHPSASNCDLAPLAFVGDVVLKYAVARYLFLNGKDDVVKSRAELHNGTQAIITNNVLAAIAFEKLHIQEYLIRGNSHKIPSKEMYASCMEAIFGAIALDCGSDQQVIFDVIENLCSQCYKSWLKESTKFKPQMYYDEAEEIWMNTYNIIWPKMQLQTALRDYRKVTSSHQKSCLQTLSSFCFWVFAIFGFITFSCIIIILFMTVDPKTEGHEL